MPSQEPGRARRARIVIISLVLIQIAAVVGIAAAYKCVAMVPAVKDCVVIIIVYTAVTFVAVPPAVHHLKLAVTIQRAAVQVKIAAMVSAVISWENAVMILHVAPQVKIAAMTHFVVMMLRRNAAMEPVVTSQMKLVAIIILVVVSMKFAVMMVHVWQNHVI